MGWSFFFPSSGVFCSGAVGWWSWATELASDGQLIVPVVLGRAKAFDCGMQGHHGASHVVTGGVGIEAAPELATLVSQRREPARVGSGARGREATALGMEGKATDSVNGRLAKDDPPADRHAMSATVSF